MKNEGKEPLTLYADLWKDESVQKSYYIFFGIIVAVMVVLGAAFDWAETPDEFDELAVVPSPTFPLPLPTQIMRQDLGEFNKSGANGWVEIRNLDGKTSIDISMDGLKDEHLHIHDGEEEGHPTALHTGSCKKLGPVKNQLTPIDEGGETILDMSVEEFGKMLPLSLVIREAMDNPRIVSCTDIASL